MPIAMDASGSYDPDEGELTADEWPMTFAWFCQISGGEGQLLSGADILAFLEESYNGKCTKN